MGNWEVDTSRTLLSSLRFFLRSKRVRFYARYTQSDAQGIPQEELVAHRGFLVYPLPLNTCPLSVANGKNDLSGVHYAPCFAMWVTT